MDREKVIKRLEHCLTLDSPCGGCPYYSYEDIQELNCERGLRRDVIALLKEQEHKDKMYHALEDDWKRLKALLKEQEAGIIAMSRFLESHGLDSDSICGKNVEIVITNGDDDDA